MMDRERLFRAIRDEAARIERAQTSSTDDGDDAGVISRAAATFHHFPKAAPLDAGVPDSSASRERGGEGPRFTSEARRALGRPQTADGSGEDHSGSKDRPPWPRRPGREPALEVASTNSERQSSTLDDEETPEAVADAAAAVRLRMEQMRNGGAGSGGDLQGGSGVALGVGPDGRRLDGGAAASASGPTGTGGGAAASPREALSRPSPPGLTDRGVHSERTVHGALHDHAGECRGSHASVSSARWCVTADDPYVGEKRKWWKRGRFEHTSSSLFGLEIGIRCDMVPRCSPADRLMLPLCVLSGMATAVWLWPLGLLITVRFSRTPPPPACKAAL